MLVTFAWALAGCNRPTASVEESCRLACERERSCADERLFDPTSTGDTGDSEELGDCVTECQGGGEFFAGVCRLAIVDAQLCVSDLSCPELDEWSDATGTSGFPCAGQEAALWSMCFGDDPFAR